VGHSFSLIEFVPFNPGSPKQIVERLNESGWKPYENTKGHIKAERELKWCKDKAERRAIEDRLQEYQVYGWSISEANLLTLPKDAPEASRKLVQRLLLASRRSTLETWTKAFRPTSGRIHGNFNHIGAWTGRMSHSDPNMANVPSGDTPYAHDMRSLWTVPKDRLLVGVDADSIQLRVLAHYMNDPVFTEALVRGDKDKGTDAHTLNMLALGPVCSSRDVAKTFIYGWLLGAGVGKVAQILGCSEAEAREAIDNFIRQYPGLLTLKSKVIPEDAQRGYFIGLDKRLVMCNNEHLMLAGYLQNGEQVIMKRANVLWRNRLLKERVPFQQVNLVHDEYQTETVNDLDVAKYIAKVQADSLRQVGEDLNLNCPMLGSIINSHKKLAIGTSWSETH
jgi:DNA polymerase-1